ncbi:DMT family transporter [Colwellia ponticola]|uniref:DMT family transporter n=1 Tax=Colwellia ponticola TaxID=2304625 RepID=A0A8H2JJV7_9GAMM|nr:DMT family transporter [Colwellia ponticola]TMM41893.1 DMT family transporter [Colwellia ponticola]
MSVFIAYLTALLIWSTTPLCVVWSSETVSPTLAVLMRMIIALCLGSLIIMFSKIRMPCHGLARKLYGYSAIGVFGGMSFSYLAAMTMPSGVISLIFGLAPILSGLLAQKILAEAKFSQVRKLAFVISLTGLAIVCSDNIALVNDNGLGILYSLLAVSCFSLSGVMVKSIHLSIHPLATAVGALFISTPLAAMMWLLFDGTLPVTEWQISSLVAIVYLGVFGSLIGLVAYFYILQQLPASTVALMTLIAPVIAIALGRYLNNETTSANLLIGASCVLSGLVLYHWGEQLLKKRQGTPLPGFID